MSNIRAVVLGSLGVLALAILLVSSVNTVPVASSEDTQITVKRIGTYDLAGTGTANIVAHDPDTQRLFVVKPTDQKIEVLDIGNPAAPVFSFFIPSVGTFAGVPTSVAVRDGVVAVAAQSATITDPGVVEFYDTSGVFLKKVTVGALPDMLTFTPNGRKVLVANEGSPNANYSVDPEGSVSIIDIPEDVADVTQNDVCTAGFSAFNAPTVLEAGIRIYGPGATVAMDLEPEFITVSHDSKKAWVTLQENNALAIIDIEECEVTSLEAFGFKDHNITGNGLDASDQSSPLIKIAKWPVRGMYMPDGIASYKVRVDDDDDAVTYLVTANEGDARDYPPVPPGFSEEARVGDSAYVLAPTVFTNATTLKQNTKLGRLRVTKATGDTDGDGDFDEIHSFGARSFSIWSADGDLVFDSGDDFEQKTAVEDTEHYNHNAHTNHNFALEGPKDDRSDDKGPEPEGVVIGKVDDRSYAFIGLERTGGVIVYDITHPTHPSFAAYVTTADSGDLSPEGLIFIKKEDSPNGKPLLVVAYEVSGTVSIYKVNQTDD